MTTMKKMITLIIAFAYNIVFIYAQVPSAFNYQAVVRNSMGEIISNHQVSFRISILTGSETGTTVYSETHSVITNDFGLANLKVGMGDNKIGILPSVDWHLENHFIKIELDINGGDTFTQIGTSQLLAVPYAFHASSADSITGSISETDPLFTGWDKNYNDLTNTPNLKDSVLTYANGSETRLSAGTDIAITGDGTTINPYVINYDESSTKHYIGEFYGGGIVFYVFDKGLHGLIASTEDLSDGIIWGNIATSIANAQSPYDGVANTSAIITQVGAGSSYAAGLCDAYTGGNQSDWYLPSAWELNLLYNAAFVISFKLENDDDSSTHGLNFSLPYYWSSTEHSWWSNAWLMDFSKGQLLNDLKSNISNVRAIRRF